MYLVKDPLLLRKISANQKQMVVCIFSVLRHGMQQPLVRCGGKFATLLRNLGFCGSTLAAVMKVSGEPKFLLKLLGSF